MQCRERHKMTVTDISTPKGKKMKGKKKESSNFEIQPGKFHSVSRPVNDPLRSVAPPSGLQALPSGLEPLSPESSYFFIKGGTCLQLNGFISLFLTSTMLKANSLLSHSNLFQSKPTVQNSLELCRSLCISWGFTRKSPLFSGPPKPTQVSSPSFCLNRVSPGMGLKVPSEISTIVQHSCLPLGYSFG